MADTAMEMEGWLQGVLGDVGVGALVFAEGMTELSQQAGVEKGGLVDLDVRISDPWSISDADVLAIVFYPSGHVQVDPMPVRQGERYLIREVPTEPGQVLIVVLDRDVPVEVVAVKPGSTVLKGAAEWAAWFAANGSEDALFLAGQAPMSTMGESGEVVDLEVTVSDPWSIRSDEHPLNVLLYPSGRLLSSMNVEEGDTYVLRNVKVRPGETVVAALNDAVPVDLKAHEPGWEPPEKPSPLHEYWPLILLAFAIVLFLLIREARKIAA